MHTPSKEMQACIDECLRCYQSCLGMAMTHCLETGGKHVASDHMRLMLGCAETCRACAHEMLMKAPNHKQFCGLCAEICDACAASCEKLDGMADCAKQCRRCAESCRKMAA